MPKLALFTIIWPDLAKTNNIVKKRVKVNNVIQQMPKKAACCDDGLALFLCGGFPGTPTFGNLPTGEEVTLFVY